MGRAPLRVMIGIGQRLPADPCHTTGHTGPYPAIRGATLVFLSQRRKTKRVKVGI